MARSSHVAVLVTLLAGVAGVAHAKLGLSQRVDVQFDAQGTAGLRIVGKTAALNVIETDGVLTLSVPLASVDTGIGLRNRHMREHLEADKYPNAELIVQRAAVQPEGGTSRDGKAQATFRLHGKERPVVLEFHVQGSGSTLHVDGTFEVDLRAHDVRVPSYLGVTVKPNVVVRGRFDTTNS